VLLYDDLYEQLKSRIQIGADSLANISNKPKWVIHIGSYNGVISYTDLPTNYGNMLLFRSHGAQTFPYVGGFFISGYSDKYIWYLFNNEWVKI
jgi:hypothetical protein